MLRWAVTGADLSNAFRSEWTASDIRVPPLYALAPSGFRRDVVVQLHPIVSKKRMRCRTSSGTAVYRRARRASCRMDRSMSLARFDNVRRLRFASRMRRYAA